MSLVRCSTVAKAPAYLLIRSQQSATSNFEVCDVNELSQMCDLGERVRRAGVCVCVSFRVVSNVYMCRREQFDTRTEVCNMLRGIKNRV